jgi:hypothetical protein
MRYDEIRSLIASTTSDDWNELEQGPLYLDQMNQVMSGGASWIEVGSHYSVFVYGPDVDLRIAWGISLDDRLDFGWHFPDRAVTRRLVDVFWRGSLVDRWTVLSVDGGRALLPDVDRFWVRTGDTAADFEHITWTVPALDGALARLLNVLAGHQPDDLETALQIAGIIELPDP